jgi:hypothetical protein
MRKKLIFMLLWGFMSTSICASDIYIGASTVDITPRLPVALMGQFHLRIAKETNTPLSANVIVIESKEQMGIDTVVFVSCDLVYIPSQILALVREKINKLLPGFSVDKIILSATHTHTSPVLVDSTDRAAFLYKIPKQGVTQVNEYRDFLTTQIASGIVSAWEIRTKGSVTWGLGRASIPYNRRVVYADGEAKMYGNANDPSFMKIEGYEDHDIHSLFFWNNTGDLIAMSIDVACPAQEVEGDIRVDADYWHPVREKLKEKFGAQLVVAGWIGAAGDQSPHPIYRKKALIRMEELSGVNRMQDISRRIVAAVEETYAIVKDDQHQDLVMMHRSQVIELPKRVVTVEEYLESKRISQAAAAEIARNPEKADQLHARMTWFGDIVNRYQEQKVNPNPQYKTEIHIIRLGDVAICTNQFELFTDYGIRIQAQSKALQTFVIQLAGPGTYLPTRDAVRGGGYSAVCQSNTVGPDGGEILVDATLELINSMWDGEE